MTASRRRRFARSTQSNAVSPSTATERDDPLTLIFKVKVSSCWDRTNTWADGSMAAEPCYIAELRVRPRAAKVLYHPVRRILHLELRVAQAYMLISIPTDTSTTFAAVH